MSFCGRAIVGMKSDEEVDSDITWKMNRNIFQNAVAIEDAVSRGPRDRSRRTQYLSLSIVKLSHPERASWGNW